MSHSAAISPDVHSCERVDSFVRVQVERHQHHARQRDGLKRKRNSKGASANREQPSAYHRIQPRHQYRTSAAYSYSA